MLCMNKQQAIEQLRAIEDRKHKAEKEYAERINDANKILKRQTDECLNCGISVLTEEQMQKAKELAEERIGGKFWFISGVSPIDVHIFNLKNGQAVNVHIPLDLLFVE